MPVDIIQYINHQKLQHAPHILGLLLSVLIAYTLAQLTWQIVASTASDHSTTVVTIPQQIHTTNPQTKASTLANTIADWSLFGKAPEKTAEDPSEAQMIDAPITDLNLKLMGILATGGEDGLAIIANNNDEKLYKIGDKILNNVTLKQVYADKVILETSRGLEILKLPIERAEGFTLKLVNPVSTTNSKEPAIQAPVSRPPPLEQKLENYRKRFIRDPASISELADVLPIKDERDGKFLGFRLTPKSDNEFFQQIGLQQGDIIVDVNGVRLDDPSRGFNALRKLMNARELNITVLRNNEEITLNQAFGR